MECMICGRPSLHGANLCPDCRAARKRAFAATVTQPLLAAASKSKGQLLRPSQSVAATVRRAAERSLFVKPQPAPQSVRHRSASMLGLAAALGVMLAVGAYSLHRLYPARGNDPSPASPSSTSERETAAAAMSVAPTLTALKPGGETPSVATPDTAPSAPLKPDTAKRAGAKQRVAATAAAPTPLLENLPAASAASLVLATPAPARPDPWEAMNEALAKCAGGLMDRVLCDLRVRQHYCADHWGKVPQCPGGVASERGQ